MNRLINIQSVEDIPSEFRDTPIGLLFKYHNLGKSLEAYEKPQILIGMCIDNRKRLIIPDNFAYVIRSGGANLRYSKFALSYSIAIGNVLHIALIGHNNCGMSSLASKKDSFVKGLVEKAGWKESDAKKHFETESPLFEVNNEIDFILEETNNLRKQYPKIVIAPLFYKIEDNRLYLIAAK